MKSHLITEKNYKIIIDGFKVLEKKASHRLNYDELVYMCDSGNELVTRTK